MYVAREKNFNCFLDYLICLSVQLFNKRNFLRCRTLFISMVSEKFNVRLFVFLRDVRKTNLYNKGLLHCKTIRNIPLRIGKV